MIIDLDFELKPYLAIRTLDFYPKLIEFRVLYV